MNYKTPLLLLAVLIGLVALTFVAQKRSAAPPETAEKKPSAEDGIARDLLETKLGDVVKIVCKKKSEPADWVFVKEKADDASGKFTWRITAPFEATVPNYEVDRIVNQLTRLQYEVSHKPTDPGAVTAAKAGLDPAELTVTLTDAANATATFEIGNAASDSETFVRLKGADRIAVGKANFKSLLKPKAMEYRDLQLWTFAPEKATKVEIDDRSTANAPVSYRFVRDGSKWNLESPVPAKATGKVDELLRTMGRLRANKWEDDRKEKLAIYGLEQPTWTIRVTVEEEVPVEKKADAPPPAEGEDPKPATEKKVSTYELHLSDQSPIGDESKNFIRVGNDSVVGTLAKTVADKFRPVMAEWRDMKVTTTNVNDATRIELKLPDGQAALVKDLGRWKFDNQGGPAEDAAVKALLKAVQDLTAVAFTDGEKIDPATMGFAQPQSDIKLTVPGLDGPERITVGGYTDAASKRLVYVRRNESASVAKVKAADVAPLLQSPRSYRDRAISDIHANRFEKLTVTTPNAFSPTPSAASITLTRNQDGWIMSDPADAPVRQDRVEKLVADLGMLRAEAIVADEAELSAYGLQNPMVKLEGTYKSPVEFKAPESAEGKPAEPPVEVQPPSQSLMLLLAEHDGKYYAKRADRPAIYQVAADFYKQTLAEFRAADVLAFDDAQVREFSIRVGDQKHKFQRKDKKWVYATEPDLPLDTNKVQNLLLQLKDLKTERFVPTSSADLAGFGLATPASEVAVSLENGTVHTLWISDRQPTSGADKGFYASIKDQAEVFLLTPEMTQRFKVNLQDLEAAK